MKKVSVICFVVICLLTGCGNKDLKANRRPSNAESGLVYDLATDLANDVWMKSHIGKHLKIARRTNTGTRIRVNTRILTPI